MVEGTRLPCQLCKGLKISEGSHGNRASAGVYTNQPPNREGPIAVFLGQRPTKSRSDARGKQNCQAPSRPGTVLAPPVEVGLVFSAGAGARKREDVPLQLWLPGGCRGALGLGNRKVPLQTEVLVG